MHWVAAEATATAAALYAATGESSYAAPSDVTWKGRPDTYHAFQATLLPRLPPSPTLATALRDNLLG